jgi:demethylmenaquinone methyltransferase/2-methoxy-6-polyprenyl-1,4-benzoquinol methylase
MDADNNSSQFKHRDSSSYDDVSEDFDRFTERFSRPMAVRIINIAALQPTDSVLDVGTGTGVLARAAARFVNSDNITGVDLSQGMLNTARRKVAEEGLKAEFLIMDAESLEFQDNTFDLVVSLYALRHFPNPVQAMAEMFRVLKPGGRIVIGVGSAPRLMTAEGIKAGLYRLTELIRRLVKRGDYQACKYLEDLVNTFLPKVDDENAEWTEHHSEYSGSVSEIMSQAGFTNVKSCWIGQRSLIETAEEFWDLQVTFSSIARKRIGSSKPDRVSELKDLFIENCTEHMQRGGSLVYSTGASILYAEKTD